MDKVKVVESEGDCVDMHLKVNIIVRSSAEH